MQELNILLHVLIQRMQQTQHYYFKVLPLLKFLLLYPSVPAILPPSPPLLSSVLTIGKQDPPDVVDVVLGGSLRSKKGHLIPKCEFDTNSGGLHFANSDASRLLIFGSRNSGTFTSLNRRFSL